MKTSLQSSTFQRLYELVSMQRGELDPAFRRLITIALVPGPGNEAAPVCSAFASACYTDNDSADKLQSSALAFDRGVAPNMIDGLAVLPEQKTRGLSVRNLERLRRTLAIKFHPDHNADADPQLMKSINSQIDMLIAKAK